MKSLLIGLIIVLLGGFLTGSMAAEKVLEDSGNREIGVFGASGTEGVQVALFYSDARSSDWNWQLNYDYAQESTSTSLLNGTSNLLFMAEWTGFEVGRVSAGPNLSISPSQSTTVLGVQTGFDRDWFEESLSTSLTWGWNQFNVGSRGGSASGMRKMSNLSSSTQSGLTFYESTYGMEFAIRPFHWLSLYASYSHHFFSIPLSAADVAASHASRDWAGLAKGGGLQSVASGFASDTASLSGALYIDETWALSSKAGVYRNAADSALSWSWQSTVQYRVNSQWRLSADFEKTFFDGGSAYLSGLGLNYSF